MTTNVADDQGTPSRPDVRVEAIEVTPIRIPLKSSFTVSYGTHTSLAKVIVRMRSSTGTVGYGEATAIVRTGNTVEGLTSVIKNLFAPRLEGTTLGIRRLHQTLDALAPDSANYAKAALDLAAHDLLGKEWGVPVSALLGGALRDRIPVVYSSVEICSPEDTVAAVAAALERGFPQVKIKGGTDPDADIQRISAVREALGDRVWIRLDVNEGYPNPEVALRALRKMERTGLQMVESPLIGTDVDGLARLCGALDMPVTVHQGLESPRHAATLIRYRAADVFTLAVQSVGGLYPAMQIVTLAENFGIPVLIGASGDLGIGTAASAHLASIVRQLPYHSDCRFQLRFVEDILARPMRIEEGFTHVPTGAGLGVEVSDDAIEKYRTAP